MLRRLLALLLLFALSAPALAMSGHCAPPPAAPAMHGVAHGGGHHPAPAETERRDCIGCVLPGLGAITLGKIPVPGMIIGATAARAALAAAAGGPETPPPRA